MTSHELEADLLTHKIWLPSDGSKWDDVKSALIIAKQSESLDQWIENFQRASDLSKYSFTPNLVQNVVFELDSKGSVRPKLREFFISISSFMKETMSEDKINYYCSIVFPSIIDRALDIHEYRPENVDLIYSDSGGSLILLKKWICAVVACCFLSIFPPHPNPNLAFNFQEFLLDLNRESQQLKFTCILRYFEKNVEQCVDLMDTVVFTRHYMTSKLAVCDLINCQMVLCPLQVSANCELNNAPEYCQIITGKKCFGDSVLKHGTKMVEKYFCERPELIAGMLFFGEMSADCSIIVQGTERLSMWDNKEPVEIPINVDSAFSSFLIFNAIGRINAKDKSDRKYYELSRILEEINRISFSLHRPPENQEYSLDDDYPIVANHIKRFQKPRSIIDVSTTSSSDSRINMSMQSRLWRSKNKSNSHSKCLIKQTSWRSSFETDSPPMVNNRTRRAFIKQGSSMVSSPDIPCHQQSSFEFDISSSTSSEDVKNRRRSSTIFLPSQRPNRRRSSTLMGQSSFQSDFSDGVSSGSRRRSSAMSDMSQRSGSSSTGSGKRSSTDFSSEMEEYFQSDVANFHRSSIKTTVIEEETVACNMDEPVVATSFKNGVVVQADYIATPIPVRAHNFSYHNRHNNPNNFCEPSAGRIIHTWKHNSPLDHYVDNLINCVSEDSRNDVAEALKQRRISSGPLASRRASLEMLKDRCHSADDALNKQIRQELQDDWTTFEHLLYNYVDNILQESINDAITEIRKLNLTSDINFQFLNSKISRLSIGDQQIFGDGFQKYIPRTVSDNVDRLIDEVLIDAHKEFVQDFKYNNMDQFAHMPNSTHLLDIPKRICKSSDSLSSGSAHKRDGSHFKDPVLSDFEDKLIHSNVVSPGLVLFNSTTEDSFKLEEMFGSSSYNLHNRNDSIESGIISINRASALQKRKLKELIIKVESWYSSMDIETDNISNEVQDFSTKTVSRAIGAAIFTLTPSEAELQGLNVDNLAHRLSHSILQDVRNEIDCCLYGKTKNVINVATKFANRVLQDAVDIVSLKWNEQPQSSNEEPLLRYLNEPIAMSYLDFGRYSDNAQLQAILSWISCSYAGIPHLNYYTMGNTSTSQLNLLVDLFLKNNITVSRIVSETFTWCSLIAGGNEDIEDLFDFLILRLS